MAFTPSLNLVAFTFSFNMASGCAGMYRGCDFAVVALDSIQDLVAAVKYFPLTQRGSPSQPRKGEESHCVDMMYLLGFGGLEERLKKGTVSEAYFMGNEDWETVIITTQGFKSESGEDLSNAEVVGLIGHEEGKWILRRAGSPHVRSIPDRITKHATLLEALQENKGSNEPVCLSAIEGISLAPFVPVKGGEKEYDFYKRRVGQPDPKRPEMAAVRKAFYVDLA